MFRMGGGCSGSFSKQDAPGEVPSVFANDFGDFGHHNLWYFLNTVPVSGVGFQLVGMPISFSQW